MKPAVPADAEVRYTHWRLYENYGLRTKHEAQELGIETPPLPRGGMTLARITFADGRTTFAYARCTIRDNFSRSKGRMIATGRALKHAPQEVTA